MPRQSPLGAWILGAALVSLAAIVAVLWPDGPRGHEPAELPRLASRAEPPPSAVLPVAPAEARPLEPPTGGLAEVAPDGIASTPTARGATVILQLTGRVVDAENRPVAGATVFLHPSQAGRAALGMPEQLFLEVIRWDELSRTQSDVDGRFTLLGADAPPDQESGRTPMRQELLAGTAVVAWHPDARPTAVPVTWSGEAALALGDIVLARGAALSARLVDDSGTGIAGAEVYIPQAASSGNAPAPSFQIARDLACATSGPDGRVLLEGLWPGGFLLRVRASGKALVSREIVLVEGETTDLGDIHLSAGGVIEGVARDERGSPLADVTVKLRATSMDVGLTWGGEDPTLRNMRLMVQSNVSEELEQVTSADGAFRFSELEPTTYSLYAGHDGCEPVMRVGLSPNGDPLVVDLFPAALLVLRVLDGATGEALEGARAIVRRCTDRVDGNMSSMDPWLTASTGAEAATRLEIDGDERGLVVAGPAGPLRHVADVSAPGYAPRTLELPGVPAGGRFEQSVLLTAAASVAGRVLDERGSPVSGAWVSAQRTGSEAASLEARADDSGRFRLGDLGEGDWRLTGDARGHVPGAPLTISLAKAEARDDIEIVLARGATIIGEVLDADDRPLGQVFVQIAQSAQDAVSRLGLWKLARTTDGAGRFRIEGVPAGPTTILIPGLKHDLVAVAGEEHAVTLRPRRAPILAGRVVDASGAPVAGVDVDIMVADDPHWAARTVRTDATGAFRVSEGLTPGAVRLVARDDIATTPTVHVELAWDRRADVLLAFAAATLRLRVVDASDGAPLPGVDVGLIPPADTPGSHPDGARTSDADGRLVFERLRPGTYRLAVRGDTYVSLASDDDDAVEVGAGAIDHVLRLQPASALHGSVLAVGMQPITGIELRVTQRGVPAGRGERRFTLPETGIFRLTGLREGTYDYVVRPTARTRPGEVAQVYASGVVSIGVAEDVRLDIPIDPP